MRMKNVDKKVALLYKEKRALLDWVLQACKAREDTNILLPVGMDEPEDWFLNNVDVNLFLTTLASGGRRVDLTNMCYKVLKPQPEQQEEDSPDRVQSHGAVTRDEGAVSLSEFLARTRSEAATVQGSVAAPQAVQTQPELSLPALRTTLDETELRSMTFMMYLACCGERDGPAPMCTVVREQLEISAGSGGEMAACLAKTDIVGHPDWTGRRVASLELYLKVLEASRPRQFGRFRSYTVWRDANLRVLVQLLCKAVEDGWQEGGPDAPTSRQCIAQAKSAERQLQVKNAEEFDEGEYCKGLRSLTEAATEIASRTRGGWQLPWGVRVRMAEILLRGVFDSMEEREYIPQKDVFVSLLHQKMWPVLGISSDVHQACYAWVHFRQAVATQEQSWFDATGGTLRELLASGAVSGDAVGADSDTDKQMATDGSSFKHEVGVAMVDWMQEQVNDYHRCFPDGFNLVNMLKLLADAVRCRGGGDAEVAAIMRAAVTNSIDAALDRALATQPRGSDRPAVLRGLAEATNRVVEDEVALYIEIMSAFVEDGAVMSIEAAHRTYGEEFKPWLLQVSSLGPSELATIHHAEMLETALVHQLAAADSSKSLSLWGTIPTLTPLLYRFVNMQADALQEYTPRMLDGETWKPVSAEKPWATSALEAIRLCVDSLDTLYDLGLSIPGQVLRALTESIDSVLQQYAISTRRSLPPMSAIIPPEPSLTRYKEQLADKARKQADEAADFVPRVEDDPGAPAVRAVTMESSLCRLHSLHYLLCYLPKLEAQVVESTEMLPSSVYADREMPRWIQDLTAVSRATLREAIQCTATFCGSKVVFWDLREPWLHALYRHGVSGASMEDVALLPAVDRCLGEAVQVLTPDMRDTFATSLLEACIRCLERVLLNGGPYRLFQVQDTSTVDADLASLKAMFVAGGQGLSSVVVDEVCSPVSDILSVMMMDTPLLIAHMESKASGSGGKAFDQDVVMRVLCHRRDREASKWLKSNFQLKKTVARGGSALSRLMKGSKRGN